jgi:hypothetical protein
MRDGFPFKKLMLVKEFSKFFFGEYFFIGRVIRTVNLVGDGIGILILNFII